MAQPPSLLQGPEPVETAELHFKLYCQLKVFETDTMYPEDRCCILAVSQYYGLIFVGNKEGFSVIKTQSLKPSIESEQYPKRDIILSLKPSHISVDFTQKTLAVVCSPKSGSVLAFYNIQSFGQKDVKPIKITPVVRLVQNLAAEVVDVAWQPIPDGSLMLCLSDGSVLALSQGAKDGPVFTLPNTTQATCFCWSPKGKQIVVGTANGNLSQYKPDLKIVKTLPQPPLFNDNSMVVSVLWISSFQFAVAYNDRVNPESFPLITIVNATKNEPVNVINYDDITYSSTLFRNHQIYMAHQSAWNLIFVSSANSVEVAVLHSKDNASWEQWLLGDASRAELPLNPDRQETFPLGWAFDFTSQTTIPWGEGTLPPMPRLLLVSDEGLLCVFDVVNAAETAPQLCSSPKENISDDFFVISNKSAPSQPLEPSKPPPTSKSLLGSPPTFGSSKPAFPFESTSGFGGLGISKPPTAVPQGPVITLQEQQGQQQQLFPQPPAQTQQQFLSNQPMSSTTSFKFPTPEFGYTSAFSLETSSTDALNSKSTSPKSTTVVKTNASQEMTLPLKPSTVQANLFTGQNLVQSTPVKLGEVSIEKQSSVSVPVSLVKKGEETVEITGKGEEVPSQEESPGPGTPDLTVVDDSVYLNALLEEIEHFNSELQQLSSKVKNLDINVGSEAEKMKMKKSIDGLYEFWKELKETTEAQNAEIHAVVMDLMESFAWLEDAKSRNLQRKNPSYIELKKSEELDPLSARHMSEISHLKYYIENQLKQLTSYLEKEWTDHQENYRNEVKMKMAVPPLEEVYKTMHFQLKILHKQKALVEELKEKISSKKRKNRTQSLLIPLGGVTSTQNNGNKASELSKLAENLLQLKINKEENFPRTKTLDFLNSQMSAISERSKKLTREKQNALRDVLSECDVVKIHPVKTTIESSSFLRSLTLEKSALKTVKAKSQTKPEEPKTKENVVPPLKNNVVLDMPNTRAYSEPEKTKTEEKQVVTKPEAPKVINVSVDKPLVSQTMQSFGKTDEKSPLASLSGIVLSFEKANETKTQPAFVFGSSNFQKPETNKDTFTFGSLKSEQKQEEPKTTQPFTFGVSKPTESIFGNKEPIVFGAKPLFGNTTTTAVVSSKPDLIKAAPALNVTISPVTVTAAVTTPKPFTFIAPTTNSNPASLPKMNLLFSRKEVTSGFGALTTSVFSAPSTASKTTSVINTAPAVFTTASKTTTPTFTTSGTSLFGVPKTTETLVQPVGFTFTQKVENKSETSTVPTPIKPTLETEEVDVVQVCESVKKPDTPPEKSKDSTKAASIFFGGSPSVSKTVSEVTIFSSAPPISVAVSSPQSSAATVSSFGKFVTPAPTPTTSAEGSTTTVSVIVSNITTTPAKITSAFSFSTAATPIVFGQTSTTTTATTRVSVFETPTTTSIFGQVSSTTPTTANIFGGSASSTPATNIFGGSTRAKPIFGQATTPSTTSENIFGATTSTTSTFGQVTSPSTSTTSTFGQVTSPSTSTTSTFVQVASPSTSTTSTFVQVASPSTSTTSTFGQVASPSTSTTSTFGQVASPSTSTTSTFVQVASPSTSTTSTFGQVASPSTSTTSTFGQVASPSTSTTSAFGQVTSPSTSTTSAFGQIASPSIPTASTFGKVVSPSTPTTFCQNSDPVSQTSNLFDQLLSDSSRSVFGASTTTPTTTSNIFNVPKNLFGGGTSSSSSTTTASLFGTPTTSIFPQTTSVFGQPTTTSSIFGQSQSSTHTSFFKPNICPPFGSGTSVTSNQNTFGSGNFSKPTFGQTTSNTSVFGVSSVFGGTSNTTSNVFQTPTTSTTFGSTTPGSFSGYGDSMFGSSSNTFQKPQAGFGSQPVFGGGPAFGSSPSFGGSPSFKSTLIFGSGSQGTFGQTSGSSTFENLANQNTVGFGNLAQQSQGQGFRGVFGSSSFENKPAFGGNSFSSWRSK